MNAAFGLHLCGRERCGAHGSLKQDNDALIIHVSKEIMHNYHIVKA
jgi:hypothetical protein